MKRVTRIKAASGGGGVRKCAKPEVGGRVSLAEAKIPKESLNVARKRMLTLAQHIFSNSITEA